MRPLTDAEMDSVRPRKITSTVKERARKELDSFISSDVKGAELDRFGYSSGYMYQIYKGIAMRKYSDRNIRIINKGQDTINPMVIAVKEY